ncbi:HPr kinase/phosphorylase [Pararhizobium mangrovi]|uniref:Serine kinase n=1 Tax=Pararhizobium mangrovi TaxID=2590452 RepID=A0A506U5N6_9HYPH|nr:hypothetical protein [Pararhizobium mangrovi]TPW28404.1 hypothetical protein FJU11_09675 [Pararhizobium mangrovi]
MSGVGEPANVHASAIVVGTTGLVFLGPSGSGKSARALACLAEAHALGLFSALVADDQILVRTAGGVVLAEAPAAIAGRIERRGTGLLAMPYLKTAVVHLVVLCALPGTAERLPEPPEPVMLAGVGPLPALHAGGETATLAMVAACRPDLLRL